MTGLIILAAGASTRLGKPKQLLKFKGVSLIRRAVKTGLSSGCDPVIVVLGAGFTEIMPEIILNAVNIIHNREWEEGIASSIRCGLTKLLETDPYVDDVIIMLCDQPLVDSALLKRLIQEKGKGNKKIISCSYDTTIGVPVLFDKTYFPEMMGLKGEEGAKKLLFSHENEVASIPFPGGSMDIDTENDLGKLE